VLIHINVSKIVQRNAKIRHIHNQGTPFWTHDSKTLSHDGVYTISDVQWQNELCPSQIDVS
jgi:hypothetical protein